MLLLLYVFLILSYILLLLFLPFFLLPYLVLLLPFCFLPFSLSTSISSSYFFSHIFVSSQSPSYFLVLLNPLLLFLLLLLLLLLPSTITPAISYHLPILPEPRNTSGSRLQHQKLNRSTLLLYLWSLDAEHLIPSLTPLLTSSLSPYSLTHSLTPLSQLNFFYFILFIFPDSFTGSYDCSLLLLFCLLLLLLFFFPLCPF